MKCQQDLFSRENASQGEELSWGIIRYFEMCNFRSFFWHTISLNNMLLNGSKPGLATEKTKTYNSIYFYPPCGNAKVLEVYPTGGITNPPAPLMFFKSLWANEWMNLNFKLKALELSEWSERWGLCVRKAWVQLWCQQAETLQHPADQILWSGGMIWSVLSPNPCHPWHPRSRP